MIVILYMQLQDLSDCTKNLILQIIYDLNVTKFIAKVHAPTSTAQCIAMAQKLFWISIYAAMKCNAESPNTGTLIAMEKLQYFICDLITLSCEAHNSIHVSQQIQYDELLIILLSIFTTSRIANI